jgi:uncharacterized protein
VRQLDPFRRFAEVAGYHNGKILNFTAIGNDVGVDFKTVQSWYQILEDTLIGFFLQAFHTSVRKQLKQAPKFYFFDLGVARALAQLLSVAPSPSTSYFGELIEQLVISEIKASNEYNKNDYGMSYLQTKAGVEVDLVLKRPGKSLALVEIKSKNQVTELDVKNLKIFEKDFPDAELFLLSLDPVPKKFGRVSAVFWQEGIKNHL